MENVRLIAPAIHCDGCAASIKRSLGKLAGVGSVEVRVDERSVSVAYDPALVSPDSIKARLKLAGFPAQDA